MKAAVLKNWVVCPIFKTGDDDAIAAGLEAYNSD
ncbi:hypothetical protein FHS21_001867 [Phyllobacterium trifolii]|uniref:Uncharacterized protein n=1 Tax=Phyllobacterium trifolii TaxID=300193 RepID=A0A839U626_9HYPH|nr:hypothetical protein [Phyllobacterium trifolii]